MPRMQVYLPDPLHRIVKERGLSASRLLQEAVRREIHRQGIRDETERYLAELFEQVGAPSDGDLARAEELSRRVRRGGVTGGTG